MNFKIPYGKHWARPFRFWFWFKKRRFRWQVKFTWSCEYELPEADQLDTNKLCGIGFLPSHHKNSARFGWRFDPNRPWAIELMAYCYSNGVRSIDSLGFLEMGSEYNLELAHVDGSYFFSYRLPGSTKPGSSGSKVIPAGTKNKFKYHLGVYFGGNQKAPHDIYIYLKSL